MVEIPSTKVTLVSVTLTFWKSLKLPFIFCSERVTKLSLDSVFIIPDFVTLFIIRLQLSRWYSHVRMIQFSRLKPKKLFNLGETTSNFFKHLLQPKTLEIHKVRIALAIHVTSNLREMFAHFGVVSIFIASNSANDISKTDVTEIQTMLYYHICPQDIVYQQLFFSIFHRYPKSQVSVQIW